MVLQFWNDSLQPYKTPFRLKEEDPTETPLSYLNRPYESPLGRLLVSSLKTPYSSDPGGHVEKELRCL